MNCNECKYTHDCFEGEKSQEKVIDEAIEIVKHGGIFDDMCEWKYCTIYPYYKVGCKETRAPIQDGDYCPYCGKKIKVVK